MTANNRLLRLPEVKQKTGLSRTSIYRFIARKDFPAPVSIGPSASAWVEQEIDDWIAARIEARDDKQAVAA